MREDIFVILEEINKIIESVKVNIIKELHG